jgi:plastocyanin
MRKQIILTSTVCLAVALLAGCAAKSAEMASKGTAMSDSTKEAVSSNEPAADKQSAPDSAANLVTIDNFKFEPRTLTVPVGTKVTWVNRDDVPHTATSTTKPRAFDSKTLDTDDKFSHVFTKPGTYDYFCAVHKHMTGQIIVK